MRTFNNAALQIMLWQELEEESVAGNVTSLLHGLNGTRMRGYPADVDEEQQSDVEPLLTKMRSWGYQFEL